MTALSWPRSASASMAAAAAALPERMNTVAAQDEQAFISSRRVVSLRGRRLPKAVPPPVIVANLEPVVSGLSPTENHGDRKAPAIAATGPSVLR